MHHCALQDDGKVLYWGNNALGQLGDGTRATSNTPVLVPGVTSAVAIATGTFHTGAARGDASVACWGYTYYEQLGMEPRWTDQVWR
jgi:alpha-tubulin suppressor-like RCC1 family protein